VRGEQLTPFRDRKTVRGATISVSVAAASSPATVSIPLLLPKLSPVVVGNICGRDRFAECGAL
jgi:hypothetical protein